MNKKKYAAFLVLVFGCIIFGCSKEDPETKRGNYLKTVTYHQTADQIRFYNYNDQGLLVSREYKFQNRIVERFDYHYNKGLISRIDLSTLKNNNDPNLYLSQQLQFEYQDNRITRSATTPGQITSDYEYDAQGKVSQSKTTLGDYVYKYDQDGNIIEATWVKHAMPFWKYYYEYDQKKNPFFNVDPINDKYDIIDLLGYKSPNNIIKETFINEEQDTIYVKEYVYEYNTLNFPTKAILLYSSKINLDYRDTTEKRTFEYEIKE